MLPRSVSDLLVRDRAVYEVTAKESLHIKNLQKFSAQTIDQLIGDAVFADSDEVRNVARWIIRQAGLETGVVPSSIHELYRAYGRKECGGFAVPAINIRGLSYDVARAVIRAAQRLKVGAFIFELARTETSYTLQRPAEFAAVMIAAAIREGFEGPLFIQGDHYQVNPKKHAKSYPDLELQAIRDLCQESIEAGYYNIDIDTSTLVDYTQTDLGEQQRANFETCAQFVAHIRSIEPQGVTVSLGGEIGEIGKQNSNEQELDAYMQGFQEALRKLRPDAPGISKISVQTGTTHGGVVLPDGSMASVAIDFDTLRKLSTAARERYGLAGAVQHGASTLPADAFHTFVECGAAEVHLATEFQNMIYENAAFPKEFKEEIYKYLRKTFAAEKGAGDTDQQFIYRTRKKGFGPFKKSFWELPADVRRKIGQDLENKFAFLFEKLKLSNTLEVVRKCVTPVPVIPPVPSALTAALPKVAAGV